MRFVRRTLSRPFAAAASTIVLATSVAAAQTPVPMPPGTPVVTASPKFAPELSDSARADSISALRRRWMLPRPTDFVVAPVVSGISPGLSIASPTGYGAQWGDGFVAVGYQRRTRFTQLQDGAIVTGVGLGDRSGPLGAELAVTSFGTIRSGVGTNSTVSAKVHRLFSDGYGVSVGIENIFRLGPTNVGPDGGRSLFVAVSRLLTLESKFADTPQQVLFNGGIGFGRFRRESDVAANRHTIGVFASVGYRFTERAAMIADMTGQDLNLAASVVPWRCVPAVLTLGFADITRSAGDGPRFVAGLGLGLHREAFDRIRHGRCLT